MMRGFFHGQEQKRLPYSCWFLLLAFLLAMPAGFCGQAYFGTITGVLTDPTGAVIPGVKLTLTDQEKGYTFNATSDGDGRYLYRSIPPGVYSVTAEMPGFEKTVRTGIRRRREPECDSRSAVSRFPAPRRLSRSRRKPRCSTRRMQPPAWWSTGSSSTICRWLTAT